MAAILSRYQYIKGQFTCAIEQNSVRSDPHVLSTQSEFVLTLINTNLTDAYTYTAIRKAFFNIACCTPFFETYLKYVFENAAASEINIFLYYLNVLQLIQDKVCEDGTRRIYDLDNKTEMNM